MSDLTAERINRKHTRYRCNQRLCVRYRIDRQEFIAYGRCTEVGRGGIGAEMPAGELPIGQAVRLEITLSAKAEPIRLTGHVKSRRGAHYGFQFVETGGPGTSLLGVLFQADTVISSKVI